MTMPMPDFGNRRGELRFVATPDLCGGMALLVVDGREFTMPVNVAWARSTVMNVVLAWMRDCIAIVDRDAAIADTRRKRRTLNMWRD